jgi:hypothetical protein
METKVKFSRIAIAVPVVLAMFLTSCTKFDPKFVLPDLCKLFEDIPTIELPPSRPPAPPNPRVVLEDVGKIMIMHGSGQAKVDTGGRIIKVEQSVDIPSYANQGTVFLNGWRLGYLGDDQHVLDVVALITKIRLDRRGLKLTWNAAGVIRDDDFEESYQFTYYYTVIAWNDAQLNLVVDQGSPDKFCNPDGNLPDKSFVTFNNGTTALSSFNVFALEPQFPQGQPIAVLPRGFGFEYPGDHHLLQLAYDLEHSEVFAERGKIYNNNKHVHTLGDLKIGIQAPLPTDASRVDSGFVSWRTDAILKDNSDRRDYMFGELVSTLGGSDVGTIQPPFSVLPKEPEGGGTTGGGVATEDVVIENVPYNYAIPMLTGWEIGYLTDDQHVKDLGIWIDDWSFGGGTLRYKLSSILRDNDLFPAHLARHKITILGIRSVVVTPSPGK